MRIMMCIAVFFLAFPLLLQDNMNGYPMGLNYRIFGRCFPRSEQPRRPTPTGSCASQTVWFRNHT